MTDDTKPQIAHCKICYQHYPLLELDCEPGTHVCENCISGILVSFMST